jgi:Cellulase (glycosyl hydrolase family 5)
MKTSMALIKRILTVAGVLAVAVTTPVTVSYPSQAAQVSLTCHHVNGPFKVRHGYMRTRSGAIFVPYGIALSPLGDSTPTQATVAHINAETDASARFWCANTVRLGVMDGVLITSAGTVNRPYLAAIEAVVARAEHNHLAVLLTVGRISKYVEKMPTRKTLHAWRVLTHLYGHDPQLMFDIFNEPRVLTYAAWRNGTAAHPIGMQRLAQQIRSYGARNLFWVQGPLHGQNLHPVFTYHLSKVGPVAYDIHHPPYPQTPASWTYHFGGLAGHYAVADGEWANFSINKAWDCWPDAPVKVPQFLTYLARRHIGLIVFNLAKPRLIESDSLTDPTYYRSNWSCTPGLNQGSGHRILDYYRTHNQG